MEFDAAQYGPAVARILSSCGDGTRLPELVCGECSSPEARDEMTRQTAGELFAGAREPDAAMAGLYLYFSCFDEAHEIAQNCKSSEGELWHAIAHRMEPDSGNAAYWYRRAGTHKIFGPLAHEAVKILKRIPEAEFRTGKWDPFSFIVFCDRARSQPGSLQEQAAREIQRAEWQLLFDYCARPK